MFSVGIGETTTFWSEAELVQLIRDKNPKMSTLESLNEEPVFSIEGVSGILTYEKVIVGEFHFGNMDYAEDFPTWKAQLDARTNKWKFRLDFVNNYSRGGVRIPPDIQIRPVAYDKGWKLAWRYKKEEESKYMVLPGIEIFRVDADKDVEYKTHTIDGFHTFSNHWLKEDVENLIYTLHPAHLGQYGSQWLREKEPIVIQKHDTYITIRASAHLARSWSVVKGYHDRPGQFFREHIMSDDEAAWISPDDYYKKKHLDTWHNTTPGLGPEAHVSGGTVDALLATLHELASD